MFSTVLFHGALLTPFVLDNDNAIIGQEATRVSDDDAMVLSACTTDLSSAGAIFGIGNPLLDISAEVPLSFLEKYVV